MTLLAAAALAAALSACGASRPGPVRGTGPSGRASAAPSAGSSAGASAAAAETTPSGRYGALIVCARRNGFDIPLDASTFDLVRFRAGLSDDERHRLRDACRQYAR